MRTDAPSHEMVVSLLCSTAEKVHNQDLSALVTKVEEDPLNGTGFVKVRTFIEELILRLQKVLFLFNHFRSDLQFFCFRLRRIEGHGLLPRGKSPRRKPSSHSRRKIQ